MRGGEVMHDITRELGLSVGMDCKTAKLLDLLVPEFDTTFMAGLLTDKKVIVFGCGPSLMRDIVRVKKSRVFSDYTIIAVDGATKALLNAAIIPHIIVSDLDGDLTSIFWANKMGSVVVLHGHGDNIQKIRRHFAHLPGRVFGTTQREPTRKVLNFGGFTDGDRAVHLAEAFKPNLIVLAGMDFGTKIGEYSGRYNREKKLAKLVIGRRLLEELAATSRTPILNLTSAGVDLKHIPRISVQYLESLTSL